MYKQRTSSTIPFGYELDSDNRTLKPVQDEIDAIKTVAELIKNNGLSLREGSEWVTYKTGRSISHVGLKKIIDNGRLDKEPTELSD